ncbi:unnamed protein product [Amoebophrya sp. A120]|nr:unnamed protein product [Amoebophrya sp. A120]|eukprot:GSA120T00004243001.1
MATPTIPHPSLAKADDFLRVIKKNHDKRWKNGISSFNAERAPFWRFVVNGMKVADSCKSCNYLRAIVAAEIAVYADRAMLPPKAARTMFADLGKKFGGQVNIVNSAEGVGTDVDDGEIPRILASAIQDLGPKETIPEDVKERLLVCAKKLMLNNKHLGPKTKPGQEMEYWSADLETLGQDLLQKIGQLNSHVLKAVEDEAAAKKAEETKKMPQQLAQLLDMMNGKNATTKSGQEMTQEETDMQNKFRNFMRPKVQKTPGGPFLPMNDEEYQKHLDAVKDPAKRRNMFAPLPKDALDKWQKADREAAQKTDRRDKVLQSIAMPSGLGEMETVRGA